MARGYKITAQQLAGKIEAVLGTAETLAAADVNLHTEGTIQVTDNFLRHENNELGEDIGAAPDFVAGLAATMAFGVILKGSGTVGTPPAIGHYLRACGLKEEIPRTVAIGAISGGSGSFAEGATYSATGSKTGYIDRTISGAGTLIYIPATGGQINSGDVITVGAASATASANSSLYGVKYSPRSVGLEGITIQRGIRYSAGTPAKDRLYRIRGAMGNAVISVAAMDTIRAQFTFQGALVSHANGDIFTGVDYETIDVSLLAKYRNTPIQLNGKDVCPSSIEINLGNNVLLEPDPCTDGGLSGYTYADIRNRAPTITMDPKCIDSDDLDEIGLLETGLAIPVSMVFGTSPNVIEFRALKAQLRAKSPGERGGEETWNGTLHVVRNGILDQDYAIYFR